MIVPCWYCCGVVDAAISGHGGRAVIHRLTWLSWFLPVNQSQR